MVMRRDLRVISNIKEYQSVLVCDFSNNVTGRIILETLQIDHTRGNKLFSVQLFADRHRAIGQESAFESKLSGCNF